MKFNLIPGRPDIFTQYAYGTFHGDPNVTREPADNDVKFAGWFTIEELFSKSKNLRIETAPILEHFLINGHCARVRHLF